MPISQFEREIKNIFKLKSSLSLKLTWREDEENVDSEREYKRKWDVQLIGQFER